MCVVNVPGLTLGCCPASQQRWRERVFDPAWRVVPALTADHGMHVTYFHVHIQPTLYCNVCSTTEFALSSALRRLQINAKHVFRGQQNYREYCRCQRCHREAHKKGPLAKSTPALHRCYFPYTTAHMYARGA